MTETIHVDLGARSYDVHVGAGLIARAGELIAPFAPTKRVFIVTDVPRTDTAQIAAAYRELFLAAGGGALGLFTAIARLRDVHKRIAPALEQAGLDLLSQHVDAMSTASLIDIFRGERDACLLHPGTAHGRCSTRTLPSSSKRRSCT